MDLDFENTFAIFAVVLTVCAISTALFYMFKSNSFSPTVSLSTIKNSSIRKRKKTDSKKVKKNKGRKFINLPQNPEDVETDKTQTSEEGTDELQEKSQQRPCIFQIRDSSYNENLVPSDSNDLFCQTDTSNTLEVTESPGLKDVFVNPHISSTFNPYSVRNAYLDTEHSSHSDGGNQNNSVVKCPTPSALSISESKPKTSKRLLKKNLQTCNSPKVNIPSSVSSFSTVNIATHILNSVSCETSISTETKDQNSTQSVDPLLVSELYAQIKQLQGQIKKNENRLTELSQRADKLVSENKQLRSKEEQTALELHALQGQYSELLQANKAIEQQKKLIDIKLRNTETENCDLLKRLSQLNSDMMKVKSEADSELCKLRNQLSKSKSNLNAMTAALNTAPSTTDLTPELYRTQEIAQAMSNDNCLLKSRIEQLESELTQQRQASIRQQQELQAFRTETRKLLAEKETALEKILIKRKNEQTEANTRLASYEAQLARRCRELEEEKQRNQEYMKTLAETTEELSRLMEHEKRQSEIISSLEYQFAELNVVKQTLLEDAAHIKAMNESTTTELHARIVSLSNELANAKNQYGMAQQKINELMINFETNKPLGTFDCTTAVTASSITTTTTSTTTTNTDIAANTNLIPAYTNIAINTDDLKSDQTDQQSTIDNLQSRLSVMEQRWHKLQIEKQDMQKLYRKQLTNSEHYKNALIETEGYLSKLQNDVQESEYHWHQLLENRQIENHRLINELEKIEAHKTEINNKLKKAELELTIKDKKQTQSLSISTTTNYCKNGTCSANIDKYEQTSPNKGNYECEHDVMLVTRPQYVHDTQCSTQSKEYEGSEIKESSNSVNDVDYDLDVVLVDDEDLPNT